MAKYYSSTIKKGSKGDDVLEWQKFLNSNGYNLDEDGIFGDATYAATTYWQTKNGLSADGIVGEDTWGKAGYSNVITPTSAPTIGAAPTLPTYNTTATATPVADPLPDKAIYDDTRWDDTTKGKEANEAYGDAKDAVTGYGDYTMGEAAQNAYDALNDHNANKPGAYQSQWQSQLDELMNSILNREKFSYDLNGDALYQQYKDKYIQQGKLAMGDAIGQASAMTGGYGNSYAQSVGQQAYQGQLDNLNDIVPQLYQMALDRYNMEGQELYNQYGMVADRENMDYGRYRDTLSDWYTDRDYLTGRADTEYERDYAQYMDKYGRLMDYLGIAKSDYYDGADMFYTEQSNKNNIATQEFNNSMSLWNANYEKVWDEYYAKEEERKYGNDLLQQGYENEFGEWEANTANAWEQAKWDESVRQYVIDQDWRQKEFDATYGDTSTNTSDTTKTNKVHEDNNNTGDSGYDNGGLTADQIKEMQNYLGIEADGKWGPGSTKASGNLSAQEAWKAYQAGNLETFGTTVPRESKNTTQFINSFQTKSEYLARGNNVNQWYEYIESKIASYLRSDRITEAEALYLIQYYEIP